MSMNIEKENVVKINDYLFIEFASTDIGDALRALALMTERNTDSIYYEGAKMRRANAEYLNKAYEAIGVSRALVDLMSSDDRAARSPQEAMDIANTTFTALYDGQIRLEEALVHIRSIKNNFAIQQ